MTFIKYDPLLGVVDLSGVDTQGPGPLNLVAGTGSGRQSFYMEVMHGYDPNLGGGEFIYAQAGATLTVGEVCQFTPSLSGGQVVESAVAWAGTANSGDVLAVAMAVLTAGQWGWFQVEGHAITNVSGAPVAGNPVYWQAAGVVSPTGVASKQMEGAKFASAPGITLGTGASAITLSGSQAVILLNRPSAQGAIT